MEKEIKKLLVVDGTNLFYRSYHGMIHQQLQFDGHPTWAVFGLINTLASAIRFHAPKYVLVAFDHGKSVYRRELYPEYKAGRKDASSFIDFEDMNNQLQQSQHILSELGIMVWKEAGIEADDVIATVVKKFRTQVDNIIILSGDKDLRQLISRKVILVHPSLGKKVEEKWDIDRVTDHYGVSPERLPEIWALSGDKADNIPGVKGIGEKTAIKYIAKHGNVTDAMWNEPRLKDFTEDIHLSYKLVQLNPDLSKMYLDLDDIEFKPTGPNDTGAEKIKEVLKQNGFDRLLNRWNSGTLWIERGKRLKDFLAKDSG